MYVKVTMKNSVGMQASNNLQRTHVSTKITWTNSAPNYSRHAHMRCGPSSNPEVHHNAPHILSQLMGREKQLSTK